MKNTIQLTTFLKLVVLLQFLTDLAIIFDLAFIRQVLGFIFITFIPGFLLLHVLKLNKLKLTETIVFSVGLSIALLMFIGLFANELYPVFGISKPLDDILLLVTLNLSSLCLISLCLKDKNSFIRLELKSATPVLQMIPFLCLPLLSALGALQLSVYQENSLYMLLLILIILLLIFTVSSKRILSPKLYPFVLFTFSLSILLMMNGALATNYIGGQFDQHTEFYLFRMTENYSRWSSILSSFDVGFSRTNSMISVTILPTMYSKILNMGDEWIFKIINSIIYSLIVPLGLYQLYSTQVKKKTAFLAAFFFLIALHLGLGPNKQRIAELFYVLLFLMLFNKNMPSLKRKILFIIFSAALVISHYSTAYIFLFTIFLTSLTLITSQLKNLARANIKISLSFVAIFFTLAFSWYMYTSWAAPFQGLVSSVEDVLRSIPDFLNPEARGESVLAGIGLAEAPSVINQIGRIFFYITEIFMLVGFTKLFISMVKGRRLKLDLEYMMLVCFNMAIMILNVVLPGLSETLGAGRFYNIALIILAPLCIIGAKIVAKSLLKSKIKNSGLFLSLAVLVPLFLFQTGFVYEITKVDSWSVALSMYRMDPVRLYQRVTDEGDALGAQWLSSYTNVMNISIFADAISRNRVLISYGMVNPDFVQLLTNRTKTIGKYSFIYLRRVNVVNGIMEEGGSKPLWNTTDISFLLENLNKIYSNGNCEIYGDE